MSGPRLVLVRGGLDERAPGAMGDWETFCDRIGWSSSAAEPAPDFEARLLERVVATGDVERESRLRAEAVGWNDDVAAPAELALDEPRRSFGWSKASTAVACAAVAALLLLAFAALAPSHRQPVAASPEASSPLRATTAPTVDRSRDADAPPDVERDPSSKDPAPPPPPPGPERRAPLKHQPPPGGRVAHSSPGDGVAPRAAPEPSMPQIRSAFASAPVPFGAGDPGASRPEDRRIDGAASPIDLAPDAARALALDAPPTSLSPSFTPASWTLPSDGGRWLGMSVSPGAAPGEPPRLGVMAQLDLAKAFGKL